MTFKPKPGEWGVVEKNPEDYWRFKVINKNTGTKDSSWRTREYAEQTASDLNKK